MGLDDPRYGRVIEEDGRAQGIDAHALDEGLEDVRIEAPRVVGEEGLHRRVAYHRVAVGLLAHHGLEGVGDGDDAREHVDLLARRLARIALGVPPLVVLEADEAHVVGVHELLRDDPIREQGMGAHLLRLVLARGRPSS